MALIPHVLHWAWEEKFYFLRSCFHPTWVKNFTCKTRRTPIPISFSTVLFPFPGPLPSSWVSTPQPLKLYVNTCMCLFLGTCKNSKTQTTLMLAVTVLNSVLLCHGPCLNLLAPSFSQPKNSSPHWVWSLTGSDPPLPLLCGPKQVTSFVIHKTGMSLPTPHG